MTDKRPLRVGFRVRLFVLSLVLICVFGAALVIWLEASLRPLLLRQAHADLERSARLAELSVPELLGSRSPPALQPVTTAAAARVTLISPDGTVVADSELTPAQVAHLDSHHDRPEVIEAQTAGVGNATRYSDTLDTDMLYVAVPVPWPDSGTGTLRLARNSEVVDRPVRELYRVMGLAGLMALIVALLMTVLASALMTRDLRRLLEHTAALARGEPVPPFPLHATVEVAGIAGSVDRLAQETQKALRALADERARSTGVLQAMRDGVVFIDTEGRLALVNSAGTRLACVDVKDRGRLYENAFSDDVFTDVVKRACSEGEAVCDLKRDGPDGPTIIEGRATVDATGACVLILRDVTELRRLETMRRDFVANVSHELRTPVSILQASAEALHDGAIHHPTYAAQFLDAILRHAERLTLLTDDILRLSRIEAGREPLDKQPVELASAVQRNIELLAPRAASRKQVVTLAVPEDLVVLADPGAIEHVLVNLLDNAMKYTPKKGTITARARPAPETDGPPAVRVEVVDNGPGIPAEHRTRLFERFYRIDTGRSRDVGGTGLGLAIVKHLIEAMDGRVGVEANHPSGSLFWFELPAAADDADHVPG